MFIYSQRDPRWRDRFMGKSKMTVGVAGCFFCMLCTMYQVDPLEMLNKHPELWNADGNVDSVLFAKLCGGVALPPTKIQPKGWCVGITDKFKPQFPTHFVGCNMDTNQQTDPLDNPAQVEARTYTFYEWRVFTNIKFAPVGTWQEEAQKWAQENGIISDWSAPDAPMTQVRVAAALNNMAQRFNS